MLNQTKLHAHTIRNNKKVMAIKKPQENLRLLFTTAAYASADLTAAGAITSFSRDTNFSLIRADLPERSRK